MKARYNSGSTFVRTQYGQPGRQSLTGNTRDNGYRYVAITRDLQGCASTFMYGKTLPSLALNPEVSLSAYCTNDGGRNTYGPNLDYKVGIQENSQQSGYSCPVLDSEKFAGSSTWMIYDLEA